MAAQMHSPPLSARAKFDKRIDRLVRQRAGWRAQLTRLKRVGADETKIMACRQRIAELEAKMYRLGQPAVDHDSK